MCTCERSCVHRAVCAVMFFCWGRQTLMFLGNATQNPHLYTFNRSYAIFMRLKLPGFHCGMKSSTSIALHLER